MQSPAARANLGRLPVLWLAALDLRITLLALPPVLPLIHRDLGLNESAVAALSNVPVLMLAGSSIFGSLVVAKLGARSALIAGIWVIAISSGLRGAGHATFVLFATTVVMGLGVATIQPAFPTLARQWFPQRPTFATAVWVNGLLAGEALAASLTLTFVMPLARGSWGGAFAIWAGVVACTALAVMLLTSDAPPVSQEERPRWKPDFRDGRQWQLGLLQAAASIAYFGANTFVPDYLHATSQASLVAPCLAALNAGQLLASIAMGLVPVRVLLRPEATLGAGAALLLAAAGLFAGGGAAIAGAGLVGLCAAFILVLSFALPALIADAADTARLSAGMYTIGYSAAFVVSLIAGALWDATHAAFVAFVPILLAAAILTILGPRMRWHVRATPTASAQVAS